MIDKLGQEVPPFPVELGRWAPGGTLAVLEIGKRPRAVAGDAYGVTWLIDLETGEVCPGWPTTEPNSFNATGQPAVGTIGPNGEMGVLVPGLGGGARVIARTLDGASVPGYPRWLWPYDRVYSVALSTLDGINTTACWTPGNYSWGSSQVDCFDVGVPWSRDNVQWGNYGFDLQHRSYFRRLWQIDRPQTCLTTPSAEIASEGNVRFDVTVCPRRADDSNLGAEQDVRFARRPIVGRFVGPVRYDPTTGNYSRTYEGPDDPASGDVEFRVFVNDELDDTMPVVHLRGRPRILAASPAGVARGKGFASIRLDGEEFTSRPSVRSTDTSLVVVSWKPVAPNAIETVVRAPATARIGWSGLQVVAPDGRASNVAPIFVYDPAWLTLVAKDESGDGVASLDWFGSDPSVAIFTLERATGPLFSPEETLYRGGGRSFEDAAEPAPNGTLYYRVR